MDVLTDVLRTVRLQNRCYGRFDLTAPWGMEVDASGPRSAHFYLVSTGRGWLELDGGGAVSIARGAPPDARAPGAVLDGRGARQPGNHVPLGLRRAVHAAGGRSAARLSHPLAHAISVAPHAGRRRHPRSDRTRGRL